MKSKKLLKFKKDMEVSFKDLKECKKTHCYGIFPDKERKEIHKKCDDEANKKFGKTKKNDKKIFSKKFDTIFNCLKKNKYREKSQKEGECMKSNCNQENNKFIEKVNSIDEEIRKEPEIMKYREDYKKQHQLLKDCNEKNCGGPDITDNNRFKCEETKCSKESKLTIKKLVLYIKKKDKYSKQFLKKNNS
jgi:hypothetical protein